MPQDQDDIKGADAMKQAPTPGPLSGDDVNLLVKGDLLRWNDEIVSVVRVIGTVDIERPNGDVCARIPADNLAFIGRPDADGWMPWSGGENPVPGRMVDWRPNAMYLREGVASEAVPWSQAIKFRLAPTAPVEVSGSFEERAVMLTKKHGNPVGTDYEQGQNDMGHRMVTMARAADAVIAALRPQPSGETRDGPEVGEDAVAKILAPYLPTINSTPDLLSILYDADLMPEQTVTVRGAICVAAVCEAYKAALRPAPVASGGQHSSGEVACKTCMDTVGGCDTCGGHIPSVNAVPAQDDDKLRIAVEALEDISAGFVGPSVNQVGHLSRLKERTDEALAALQQETQP